MKKIWACILISTSLAILPGCDPEEEDEDDVGDNERTDGILELQGDATNGEAVFGMSCGLSSCHGADGDTPATAETASLSDEVPEFSDRALVNIMLNGYETMPPQSAFSDQELADVLAYLRDTFGG